MFKIGNIEIENNVCLAPMAGICNSAFRRIVKEYGAGLVFAEMVSDKALCYDSDKTKKMLYMTEYERPIAQQIFGSDKKSFVIAAKKVYELMKPDIIDINMGCPVPKVAVKSQAGAALLKNPEKIKEIVEAVVDAVPCPVTVKIRSGWDKSSINAVDVAKICEQAGASAITVHPRTRAQGYEGKADWNIIKQVKENVNIPVIGNGDIKSIDDAIRMFSQTGCDAIMIGRASLGNPYIFKEITFYLQTGNKLEEQTFKDKIDMCLKHFDYLLEIKNEKTAVLEMRTHAAWYIKGLKGSSIVKNQIFKCETKEELIKILNDYKNIL
ncbi:MAG: tRNA dihydrouridine synthase DusB [Bacilli bacterium]|nr:tRNA dihydrouridine synthase DusB [Bacilli bacterium]